MSVRGTRSAKPKHHVAPSPPKAGAGAAKATSTPTISPPATAELTTHALGSTASARAIGKTSATGAAKTSAATEEARIVVRGVADLLASAKTLADTLDESSDKKDATRLDSMLTRLAKDVKTLEPALKTLVRSKEKDDRELLRELGARMEDATIALRRAEIRGVTIDARHDEVRWLLPAKVRQSDVALKAMTAARSTSLETLGTSLAARGATSAARMAHLTAARASGDYKTELRASLAFHLAEGNASEASAALAKLGYLVPPKSLDAEVKALKALGAHGVERPSARDVVAHGAAVIPRAMRDDLDRTSSRLRAAHEAELAGVEARRSGAGAAMFFNPFAWLAAPAMAASRSTESVADVLASSDGARAIEHMRTLRAELLASSSITHEDAVALVESIGIYSGFSKADRATIQRAMVDFVRITNGRGLVGLGRFELQPPESRAETTRSGTVYVPPDTPRASVWHEAGHHVEFESTKTRDVAVEWLTGRAQGGLQRLRDIPPYAPYAEDEVGYDAKLATPYAGRVYLTPSGDGRTKIDSTEVVSVALERFASPEDMAWLYLHDPEHFQLLLGLVRS